MNDLTNPLAKLLLSAALGYQLAATAFAQGTALTYQGRLTDSGLPANGSFDIAAVVCSAPAGLTFVSGIVTNSATPVSNGVFTVTMDFGPSVFDGSSRWLALFVRTNGTSSFSTLLPRQAVSAAPYAVMAGSASNVTGTVSSSQLSSNVVLLDAAQTFGTAHTFTDSTLLLRNSANTFSTLLRAPNSTSARIISAPDASGVLITSGNLADITAVGSINSGTWNGTAVSPARGGTGLDSSAAATGSLLYTTGAGTWSVLPPGTNSQVLKISGGVPGWGVDNSGLNAALATNVVAGISLTNAFITNSVFAGNGAGLTNLNAQFLNGLASSNFLTLNGGSISAGQFIGSTNNVPLEFRVSNLRVFRIELGASGAPNIIAGAPNNNVSVGVVGATIAGGGATNYAGNVWSNSVAANLGTVSGGASNRVSGTYGVVGGGLGNAAGGAASGVFSGDFNTATGDEAFVGGGFNNDASASSSVVAGGNNNLATNYAATISGGDHNTASGSESTVAGGYNNTASGNQSGIGGGYHNLATGLGAYIAGGRENLNEGSYSSISGGFGNDLAGAYASIGGGRSNAIVASDATIAGGRQNSVTNDYGFIGGGFGNLAGGIGATVGGGNGNSSLGVNSMVGGGSANTSSGFIATVAGGDHNLASGNFATVAGGSFNSVSGQYASAAGGFSNSVSGQYAFIGGGEQNQASATYANVLGGLKNRANGFAAAISGGYSNTVSGTHGFIGSGERNAVSGNYAVVSGGTANTAQGLASVVGGGENNAAVPQYAAVAGGYGNRVETGSDYSFIGGGLNNQVTNNSQTASIGGGSANFIGGNSDWATISGGRNHTVLDNAQYATIPGGRINTATNYGFAAGHNAQALHTGAFVWSDSGGTVTASTNNNSVTMRARGGYRFFTTGGTAGASLDSGSTSWAVMSDRNVKKDFAAVDAVSILEKLSAMPITQWRYNWEAGETTPHIGPMAQDFKHAFYPGADDKTITTLEADGVALAAIQGLNQKLQTETEELRRENAGLKLRLDRLERLLESSTK